MSIHTQRPHSALTHVDRRSSPYDDDPMVRLTGLSLDPDFPPHHHSQSPNNPGANGVPTLTVNTSSTPRDGDSYNHQQQQPASARSSQPPPSPTRGGGGGRAPSRNTNNDEHDGEGQEEDDQHAGSPIHGEHDGNSITLRALVSSREAGVIIGKGGKNVAEVREKAGVRAGVSKVVQGVQERILTVSGSLPNVATAFKLIAKHLLENPTSPVVPAAPDQTTIRLLVSHQLMGSVIGKAGARIREIQEDSGAKIVVSKEMLPQSTERIIDIYGLADCIQIAVNQIGECILADYDRAAGTIPYQPQPRTTTIRTSGFRFDDGPTSAGAGHSRRRSSLSGESPSVASPGGPRRFSRSGPSSATPTSSNSPGSTTRSTPGGPNTAEDGPPQTLTVPNEMIGCIIGKGGQFINQIRRISGARLRIDDRREGHDERTVFISGPEAATKRALNLLYQQLEQEKEKRQQMEGYGHEGEDV